MSKKTFLLILFLFGLIIPFIPVLTVIEFFFLLIPFVVFFIGTLVFLIILCFDKHADKKNAIFLVTILPVFLFSQLFSAFTIDKIQRFRSNSIIEAIQINKLENYPEKFDVSFGIKLVKINGLNEFEISYSRGFMITEKYYSKNKKWNSYGWND